MTDLRIKSAVARLGLTGRERQVVECLADGQATRQVAETIGICESTVRTHIRKIFIRLGVNTRTGLLSHVLKQVVADRDGDEGSVAVLGVSAGEADETGAGRSN